MKRNFLHTLCGLCLLCVLSATVEAQETAPIISQTESGITFVVDEDLPAPKKELRKYGGDQIAKFILNGEQIGKELYQIVATSFGQDSLINCGKDVFYQCIVQAYADHRAVCISPDMVWLLISQGFARYVNAHAEDVRDLLVSHEGKMDLSWNRRKTCCRERPIGQSCWMASAHKLPSTPKTTSHKPSRRTSRQQESRNALPRKSH